MRQRGSKGFTSSQDGGASPLFPPRHQDAQSAKAELLGVVRRDPKQFGIQGTRWTLEKIRPVCHWLRLETQGGMSRLLRRLDIRWKRGREHLHSPDPHYDFKLAVVQRQVYMAHKPSSRVVTFYMDEFSYGRQPTLAQAYEEQGSRFQPLAERSYRRDTETRVVGALNVRDGQVLYLQANRIGVDQLVQFYQKLCATYAQAERIWVVQDNWPVHFHPDLLVALERQTTPWPMRTPPNWPKGPSQRAIRKWGDLKLPIQLVLLPTYAPWTNPIEKLWRWTRQEVLHMHRLADRLPELREAVEHFLDRFADGSQDLLRYTGLLVPD